MAPSSPSEGAHVADDNVLPVMQTEVEGSGDVQARELAAGDVSVMIVGSGTLHKRPP